MNKAKLTYTAVFFVVVCLCLGNCDSAQHSESKVTSLVNLYCGTCHAVPSPSLLPRQIWAETVLPRMGYFLGIYGTSDDRAALIENNVGGQIVNAAQIFPMSPTIEPDDWSAILNYYLTNAPDSLIVPEHDIPVSEKHFKPVFPEMYLSPPATTLAKFSNDGQFYIGDANKNQLFKLNNVLKPTTAISLGEGVVDLQTREGELWVTVMGSFSPTDAPSGSIIAVPDGETGSVRTVIDQLQRPVHASYGDFHGDGFEDILVSQFGKWTGGLSLFQNMGDGRYEEYVLRNTSGATKTYIRDMNGDRRPDIVALFAQGDEGIDIFYNRGNSEFQRNRVLQFSPSHGSSSFTLYDWDNDGFEDIIYTAGDNADYTPVLKPYHGIYIYLNDGQNQFNLAHFEHLNGAYAAIPGDFDDDGLLDLAAISFFPDRKNSGREGFVFFRNTGGGAGPLQFEATTVPGFDKGRWLVMDAGDHDNDGDTDLILGSLSMEVIPDNGEMGQWIRNGLGFILLENLSK